jgi:hypothetical protein
MGNSRLLALNLPRLRRDSPRAHGLADPIAVVSLNILSRDPLLVVSALV